jgi:endonuclease/exonuclease/phosphatase family metal-dependent hydrolase
MSAPRRLRLITWNVARRVEALAAQAAALAEREPDIVALQEVTARSLRAWEAAFATLDLPHVDCTLRGADPARAPAGRRRTGVLLAARWALEPLPALPLPWPETGLARGVAGIEVHTVHVPNAANGVIKPDTLSAVRTGLANRSGPLVLCGDLNTPRREHPDGTVWTFARESRGALRPERGERWDAAEQALVRGLEPFGYRDAFRTLHGYTERSATWAWPTGGGYRLDHLIVSASVEVERCEYRHEWRTDRLSDHSGLVADLAIGEA